MNNFLERIDLNSGNNLINNISKKIEELQKDYLNSNLKNVIDSAINIGIKTVLPDFVEDQAIEIKDTILNEGIKEGINSLINSSMELGKTAIGIFTGNFENISQIQMAVEKGGLIDGLSDILDFAIKTAQDNKLIDKNMAKTLKSGKNQILKTIDNSIENNINDQLKSVNKINTYTQNWNEAYKNKDFDSMEKEYKKIEKGMEKIIPLENLIKDVRKIENVHNLIKNNGGNFNITSIEKALVESLY